MSFRAGQSGDLGGVDWRVVKGRKSPTDLRLEVRAMEFVPVKMTLGFLLADFFYDNEHRLYPPEMGFQGGERYMNFLRGAVRLGWRTAEEQLELEKAAA